MEFMHVGVPTQLKRPGEVYMEGMKLFIVDPSTNPYSVEWLRFEPGSPMPMELQTMNHVAYKVDDIAAAVQGKKVLVPPTQVAPELTIAFILEDKLPIEFMQVGCQPASGCGGGCCCGG